MIALHKINKIYKNHSQSSQVLYDISLKIHEGDFLGITGPSGCGKSTLMHIIGCMDSFNSGEYVFFEHDISKMSKLNLSYIRNKYIGFIFQSFYLLSDLTILENVMLPMQYAGCNHTDCAKRAKELLGYVGMQKYLNYIPKQLSGGQQQRVAVARSLANNPKLILADEPTGNLDRKNSIDIMDLLIDLNESSDTTIVLVTHDQGISERCKQRIKIIDGRITDQS